MPTAQPIAQQHGNAMPARTELRAEVAHIAHLRRADGSVQPVTIRDVSRTGLRAICFNPPAVRERVSVKFPSGYHVQGVVRWTRKGFFGVKLHTPIDDNWLGN